MTHFDNGDTLPWGENIPPDKTERLKAGEIFTLLDEHGEPLSKVLMDSFGTIRERLMDKSESACVPNGFGLCTTHPTCDHVRHALESAQREVAQLRANVGGGDTAINQLQHANEVLARENAALREALEHIFKSATERRKRAALWDDDPETVTPYGETEIEKFCYWRGVREGLTGINSAAHDALTRTSGSSV